jgi:hypothetical protein
MYIDLTIQNVSAQKFLTGFFDKIKEFESKNEFFIVGYLRYDDTKLKFFSELYSEKKGINGMIKSGVMLENGLMAPTTEGSEF